MSVNFNVIETSNIFNLAAQKLGHFLIPWKTRRRIFLSSIYGMVVGATAPDIKHADQLAKVLNLARDHKALEFPLAIKSVIWFNTTKDLITVETRKLYLKDLGQVDLTEKERDELVVFILRRTPGILKYAKPNQMAYDLKCLSNYLRGTAV